MFLGEWKVPKKYTGGGDDFFLKQGRSENLSCIQQNGSPMMAELGWPVWCADLGELEYFFSVLLELQGR